MLKVMIADDEPYVRQMIRGMVNWEAMGLFVSAECFNGQDALHLLETEQDKADILITDIKMPLMNGIELMEKALKKLPNLYVIVISAYDDFHLVRSAFQLGAKDYLLKSEMTREQLYGVLSNARLALLADGSPKNEGVAASPPGSLLQSIVNGNARTEALALFAENLGLSSGSRYAIVGIKLIRQTAPPHFTSRLIELYQNEADSLSLPENYRCEAAIPAPEEFYIFAAYSSEESISSIMRHLVKIQALAGEPLLFDVGVSHIAESLSLLPKLAYEARAALEYAFLQGHGSVVHYNYIQNRVHPFEYDAARLLSELEKRLFTPHCAADTKQSDIFFLRQERLGASNIPAARELYMRYYLLFRDYASQRQAPMELLKLLDQYDRDLKYQGDLKELNQWLREILEAISKKEPGISTIQKIKLYIHQNYGCELTLQSIADEFYLSGSYLSRLFSEKERISLFDYISRVRVQEAIRLMENTNMKIYEITEQVGYANPEHFSRVFKKIIGVSPKKYMADHIGGAGTGRLL